MTNFGDNKTTNKNKRIKMVSHFFKLLDLKLVISGHLLQLNRRNLKQQQEELEPVQCLQMLIRVLFKNHRWIKKIWEHCHKWDSLDH